MSMKVIFLFSNCHCLTSEESDSFAIYLVKAAPNLQIAAILVFSMATECACAIRYIRTAMNPQLWTVTSVTVIHKLHVGLYAHTSMPAHNLKGIWKTVTTRSKYWFAGLLNSFLFSESFTRQLLQQSHERKLRDFPKTGTYMNFPVMSYIYTYIYIYIYICRGFGYLACQLSHTVLFQKGLITASRQWGLIAFAVPDIPTPTRYPHTHPTPPQT